MAAQLPWACQPTHRHALVEEKNGEPTQTVDLGAKAAIVLGRNAATCDVPLDHPSLSRQHAAVATGADQNVYLVDLGSSHGTFLNGQRVRANERAQLQAGDTFTLGGSSRVYRVQFREGSPKGVARDDAAAESAAMPPPPARPPRPAAATARSDGDDDDDFPPSAAASSARRPSRDDDDGDFGRGVGSGRGAAGGASGVAAAGAASASAAGRKPAPGGSGSGVLSIGRIGGSSIAGGTAAAAGASDASAALADDPAAAAAAARAAARAQRELEIAAIAASFAAAPPQYTAPPAVAGAGAGEDTGDAVADRRAETSAAAAAAAGTSRALGPQRPPAEAAAASAPAAAAAVAGDDDDDADDGGEESEGDENAAAAAAAAMGLPVAFGTTSHYTKLRQGEYKRAKTLAAVAAADGGEGGASGTAAAATVVRTAVAGAAGPAAKRSRRSDDGDDDSDGDGSDDAAGAGGGDDGSAAAAPEDVAAALRLPISHEVVLGGHTKTVTAVAWDTAGGRVASAGNDYSVRLYDFGGMDRGHKPFRTVTPWDGQPVVALAWASTAASERLLVGTTSAQPRVYDRDGNLLITFKKGDVYQSDVGNTKGHIGPVTGAVWHPVDPAWVATSSLDSSLRLWNLDTGKMMVGELMCAEVIRCKNVRGVKTGVTAVAFTPDGRCIVGGCEDGSIQVYVIKSPGGRYVRPDVLVRAAHGDAAAPGSGAAGGGGGAVAAASVCSVVVSPDGSLLASRGLDGRIRVWPLASMLAAPPSVATAGDKFTPLVTITDVPTLHGSANVCFSPDGALLAAGTAGGGGKAAAAAGGSGTGDAPAAGSAADGRVLLFDVKALTAAAGRAAAGGFTGTADSCHVYAVTAVAAASAVTVVWHPRVNQLAVGCSDGGTHVLYSPAYSTKGAMLSTARAPKRRDLSDQIPLSAVGRIVTPHALPLFRDGGGGGRGRGGAAAAAAAGGAAAGATGGAAAAVGGKKRKFTEMDYRHSGEAAASAAAAAAAPRAGPAASGPAPITGPGDGGAAGDEMAFLNTHAKTFTQYYVQHALAGKVNIREQDPAAVLRAYDTHADRDSLMVRAAYAKTQPVPIYAARTLEQEELDAKAETEALLRNNVAGR